MSWSMPDWLSQPAGWEEAGTHTQGPLPCGQEMWGQEVYTHGPGASSSPSHKALVAEAGAEAFLSAQVVAAHPHSTHGAAVLQGVKLREASPGRSFVPSGSAYLLSNQEPTLDETVQHLLTVAVGRLAGLGRKKSMRPQDS